MKIIRTKRKTLSLSLDRQGEPLVRAPLHCPDRVIMQFLAAHQAWLERQIRAFRPPKEYTEQEIAALRKKAEEWLPGRVAFFANRMNLRPAGVRITAARSRYGSCNQKGGLCFSLFLMEKSPRAIDYVVVHELAHILQPNHSPAFYGEIAKILPDYRERIKELKQ